MMLRFLLAALAGLVVAAAVPAIGNASPAKTAIACVNPASGASWRITIDYAHSTVDSNPAQLTSTEITWFDPKDGGHYTLDRKTGDLTATIASSTGGYFRHARCRLGGAR